MKTFPGACRILSILLAICTLSCGRKANVKYREEGAEETRNATKEAFAAPAGGNAENVSPEIDRFFRKLGEATRRDSAMPVDEFLSLDAMVQAMESGGMLDTLDREAKKGFRAGFKSAGSTIGTAMRQMAYDSHRILKIEEIDKDERLAYVRHYDNELNATTQIRWWLVRTERGWRVYDFEDLSVGLRTVSLIGTLMSSGLAQKPEPWIADFMPLAAMINTIDYADIDSLLTLDEPLQKLRRHKLPPDIKRFASMLNSGMLQGKGDAEGSIAELEAASAGGYSSPLHHYLLGHSLMQLERYGEALESFEKHSESLGWDSDVLESVSDCHFLLGDIGKARQAALDGLADNPASINCLCCLAAASSPDEIGGKEFRGFLDQCGDPAAGFEVAFDYLLDSELLPQSKAMLQLMEAYLTDEELKDYYREAITELESPAEDDPTESGTPPAAE